MLVALREIDSRRIGEGSSAIHDDAELEVIFTRRTATLSKHSGQVAFPGGGMDPEDASPEAAALRETHEELAIPVSAVSVIGRLDDVLSNSGFHVTPVVGLVAPSAVLTPAVSEVARVFSVPLADLADKGRWQIVPFEHGERSFDLPHFYADGEDIWGLTALMLMRLLELL